MSTGRHELQSRVRHGGHYALESMTGQIHANSGNVKFGVNAGVGTTEEDIWEFGGLYNWQTTADRLVVSSTSDEDKPLGTGLYSVHIFGLDENWEQVSEVVTLDGTTPVFTVNNYIRINRAHAEQAASRDGQVGSVVISSDASGDIVAYFTPENNQTLQACYTVPKGKVAAVMGVAYGTVRGEQAYFRFWSRDNRDALTTKRVRRTANNFQSFAQEVFPVPYIMDEMTDMWVSAVSLGGPTINATAEFSMILLDRGHVPVFSADPLI